MMTPWDCKPMAHVWRLITLSVLLIGFSFCTFAQEPSFVIFNAPGAGTGAYQGTFATTISQSGIVAGYYLDSSGAYHGFFRLTNGQMTSFDVPGLPTIEVWSANIHGQIAGDAGAATGNFHGYIRNPNGHFIIFDPPGSTFTAVGRMNDNGDVTGYFVDASNIYHGYIRDAVGNYTVIDDPDAAQTQYLGTIPTAINNLGAITGQYTDVNTGGTRAFIRDQSGNFTNFDAVTGGSLQIFPEAINSNNQIAGLYYKSDTIFHSFFRDANGVVTDFDMPKGTQGTAANGMNDSAVIVGTWTNSALLTQGFERDASGNLTSFSAPKPSNGTYPTAINNKGKIAGYYYDANNVIHGFVK